MSVKAPNIMHEGLPEALSPEGMPMDDGCLPVEMREVTFANGQKETLPIYTLTQADLRNLNRELNSHLYRGNIDSNGKPLPFQVAVLQSPSGEVECIRVIIEKGTPFDQLWALGARTVDLAKRTTGSR